MARGTPLPLSHRLAWSASRADVATSFIAVRDAEGRARFGLAVAAHPSRALPGFRLARVERLDPAVDPASCARALDALTSWARRLRSRTLRVYVELFSRDAPARVSLAAHLRRRGFTRSAHPRSYSETLLVDLSGTEEQIFARLHATGRRHVRAVARAPVALQPISDVGLAPRLDELMRETFARTGGRYQAENWASIIDLSTREPGLSRVIGLFAAGSHLPASLLAFAWGRMNGDHADYAAGASTRASDVRTPLGYGTIWDLMRWAKREGAAYFDLGGITAGTHDSADPLGGISDFKRYFGGVVAEVGEEWALEPTRLAVTASAVVRAVGKLAGVRS